MALRSKSSENRNKVCISNNATDNDVDILFRENSFSQIKGYFAQANISVQPDTRLDIIDRTKYQKASAEHNVRIPNANYNIHVQLCTITCIFKYGFSMSSIFL